MYTVHCVFNVAGHWAQSNIPDSMIATSVIAGVTDRCIDLIIILNGVHFPQGNGRGLVVRVLDSGL